MKPEKSQANFRNGKYCGLCPADWPGTVPVIITTAPELSEGELLALKIDLGFIEPIATPGIKELRKAYIRKLCESLGIEIK